MATNKRNWHAESQGDHDEHAQPVPPEAAHSGPMVARGVHDREVMVRLPQARREGCLMLRST